MKTGEVRTEFVILYNNNTMITCKLILEQYTYILLKRDRLLVSIIFIAFVSLVLNCFTGDKLKNGDEK